MTNTGRQIANLMMDNGKSASDMTHAIKALGNGSMQQGFSSIGAFFKDEASIAAARSLAKGRVQGGIVGILGTVTVGSIIAYAVNKKKKMDDHEAKGRIILKTMEATVSESDKEAEVDSVESKSDIATIE